MGYEIINSLKQDRIRNMILEKSEQWSLSTAIMKKDS